MKNKVELPKGLRLSPGLLKPRVGKEPAGTGPGCVSRNMVLHRKGKIMNDDTGNNEVFDRNDRALAVMAHDIKIPLTSIVSLLNVIKKGYVTDYDKVKDLVTRAGRQAETLIAMIDDILDYTLLADKSKVQREAVHL
jgi:signal transduction histidine kinase